MLPEQEQQQMTLIHGHPVWFSIASFLHEVTKVIINVGFHECSGDIFLQFCIFSAFSDLQLSTPYGTSVFSLVRRPQ